jgi:hypothetical protein
VKRGEKNGVNGLRNGGERWPEQEERERERETAEGRERRRRGEIERRRGRGAGSDVDILIFRLNRYNGSSNRYNDFIFCLLENIIRYNVCQSLHNDLL